MTLKEFEGRQSAMSDKELIELSREEVSKMCKSGGKSFRMCVPPMVTDTDMLLVELIRRYEALTLGTKE
jgi:hypothetical protein